MLAIDSLQSLLILPLAVLPGVWVSHTLGRGVLNGRQSLALALVLSPFVVAVQMLLLRAVGLPFLSAAWTVLLLNLPAAALLYPRVSKDRLLPRRRDGSNLFVVLLASGGIAYAAWPWLMIEGYRIFGYHNFLYIDAVYALARADGLVPEEAQMAGHALGYPWFSQLFVATVGRVSDVAPTFLYCVMNAVQLLALTICIFSAARDELRMKLPAAIIATGLIFWGQNIPGSIMGFFAPGGAFAWAWLLGDMRTGPFLLKFNNANAMPFGLAILSATVLLALVAGRSGLRRTGLIIAVLLVALGTIYPALLPPAGLLGAMLWALAALPLAVDRPKVGRRELLTFAACLAIAAGASYLYKLVITADLHMAAIWVSEPARMLTKSAMFVVSMVLLLIPALLFLMRSLKQRHWSTLVLLGFVLVCVGLNIAFSMGGNIEYKFLYGAAIGMGLLAGRFVDSVVAESRLNTGIAGLLVACLLVFYGKHSYGYRALVPGHIEQGPRITESSFVLGLHESETDAGWTHFVRTETPLNSVVVTNARSHHVGTYLGRSMYVAVDEGDLARRVGYAETAEYNLITLRGYPEQTFESRLRTVEALYNAQDETAIKQVLMELKTLGCPVVLHFEQGSSSLEWLRVMLPEGKMYDQGGHSLWLLPCE